MAKIRLQSAIVLLATVSLVAGVGMLAIPAVAAEPPEPNKPPKSSEVQEILDKYRAARPDAKDLAWFSLDWAATLKEAKERASKEQRPILFLHTNGRGNLFCGFC